jgi:hypothetical protein
MIVIQTHAEIGEDRVLTVKLPSNTPTGAIDLLVVVEPHRKGSAEERRAAADAGFGALRWVEGSTEDFLAERQEDDLRRDRALGG